MTLRHSDGTATAGVKAPPRSARPASRWTQTRQLSPRERADLGLAARLALPPGEQGEVAEFSGRPDPVAVMEDQAGSRLPELVPVRHARMMASPFDFFRGNAQGMAIDLGAAPTSGLRAQICGDAHLSNFGLFGSAERRLVFDLNDFDETAPGPWEWDVKRLAARFVAAARESQFPAKAREQIVRRATRSYRQSMREFAAVPMLEVWYAHLDMDDLLPRFRALHSTKTPAVWKAINKARANDSLHAFKKLCHTVNGEPRIISDPPLITPVEELRDGFSRDTALEFVRSYGRTLRPDRRYLLE